MKLSTWNQRRQSEQLSPEKREQRQVERFNQLLARILPYNSFYARKLQDSPSQLGSLSELSSFPTTRKHELMSGGGGPWGTNLTFPLDEYIRFHRTSGTRGHPLAVLDTAEDWQWWLDCWQFVLDAADIGANDRVLMAFSFGPFIGFWSAHDACVARGSLVIPSGGMTSLARLDLIRSTEATSLFCTPSYALHMAEVAEQHGNSTETMGIRRIVVAGEPGGSMPAVRQRLESAWNATVIDHAGASEIGPWGYGDTTGCGLHVNEQEFIAEFLRIGRDEPAGEGELAELVLTNLGRIGSPVIRFRTGDLVRPLRETNLENRFVLLEGGVLGRVDDMLIVRGVNVFPSAIEQILREFPEIAEFRLTASRRGEMDQLDVEIEDQLEQPERVAQRLHVRLGLRVDVKCVPLGSLPRFEAKGKRFIDQRGLPEM